MVRIGTALFGRRTRPTQRPAQHGCGVIRGMSFQQLQWASSGAATWRRRSPAGCCAAVMRPTRSALPNRPPLSASAGLRFIRLVNVSADNAGIAADGRSAGTRREAADHAGSARWHRRGHAACHAARGIDRRRCAAGFACARFRAPTCPWCASCRTSRRWSAPACRCSSPPRRSAARSGAQALYLAACHGRSALDRRRNPDGCRHRRLGQRSGLLLPAHGAHGARGRGARTAATTWCACWCARRRSARRVRRCSPDTDLAALRASVTSPGGTTAAALAVFEQAGFPDTLRRALTAARDRGVELGRASR